MLRNDEMFPSCNTKHKLVVDYDGYWELHIEPDWLFSYKKMIDKLYLFDAGTHANLFE